MQVLTVPCLKDNLAYLLADENSGTAVLIDACEARPIQAALQQHRLQLRAILVTHHHHDHVGGLAELPAVPTYSSRRDFDRIPAAGGKGERRWVEDSRPLRWKDLTGVDAEIEISTLAIPGHTEGQIAIIASNPVSPNGSKVFVGDTLFSFGCGRCFEGTPAQLFASLQKIKALPDDSVLYFGHEYTEQNLRFWQSKASDQTLWFNSDRQQIERMQNELHTLPRPAPTLKTELQINPFLQLNSVEEFTYWRSQRDRF